MRPDLRFHVVPAANQLPQNENPKLFTGFRTSPDFADLNADGYIDAVVGNLSGGLSLFFGREYDISLPENKPFAGSQFDLYPNPASSQVIIKQNAAENDIFQQGSIFNLSGQQVMRFMLSEGETTLNVSQLSTGMYLMVLSSDGKRATERLLINQN